MEDEKKADSPDVYRMITEHRSRAPNSAGAGGKKKGDKKKKEGKGKDGKCIVM